MRNSTNPAQPVCGQCSARARADALYTRMVIAALCILIPLALVAAIF